MRGEIEELNRHQIDRNRKWEAIADQYTVCVGSPRKYVYSRQQEGVSSLKTNVSESFCIKNAREKVNCHPRHNGCSSTDLFSDLRGNAANEQQNNQGDKISHPTQMTLKNKLVD